MKVRGGVLGQFVVHTAIGLVLRTGLQWPFGNGDLDKVPGDDRPGRGVKVRCTACGHTKYLRRWKYSVTYNCPKCDEGTLQRVRGV
jgi:hypothetical protein